VRRVRRGTDVRSLTEKVALALALAASLSGCSLATRAGVGLFYEQADLPTTQIVRDICYTTAPPCDTPKHTLDLYRPATTGWPVIIFAHGGNWNSGDKNYRAGGADVYANIGRFYAARGIGVAVINYRLQPTVTEPSQVDDVRAAMAWVRGNIARDGGRPDRIFLMGHSAGTQLATLAALTTAEPGIRGVIAVSGAALDVAARSAHAQAPPFLILYATGETTALQRQSQMLHTALTTAGASSTLLPIPGESHTRMVLALTHPQKLPAQAILDFVRGAG
jgi:acetyl esterase/lipase